MFLEAHFGDVSIPRKGRKDGNDDDLLVMDVVVDNVIARVDLISMVSLDVKHVLTSSGWSASLMI